MHDDAYVRDIATLRITDAEEAGGKGMRVGGAEVSTMHANFFFNVDNATASDIRALITKVQEMVRERLGVELQTEVQIVGEW